jgi:tetratricopeptide (TPR) repeat protein
LSEFRYATRGRAQREAILRTFADKGQPVAFDRTAEMTYEAWNKMFHGDTEGARSLAQEALVIEGENLEALGVLGEAALIAGDLKQCEEYLFRAVNAAEPTQPVDKDNPNDALRRMHWSMAFFHTLESIAALCIEQGENDQAIAVLERLPSTAFAYLPWSALVLARLYTVKQNPEKAMAALKHCMNFRFPGTSYDVALCQIMLGDALRAAQALREGFFQSPYIACEILGEPAPGEVRRGAPDNIHEQMKEIARRYMNQLRQTWESLPGAIDFVRDLWNHPQVKAEAYEYCEVAQRGASSGDETVVKESAARLTELLNAKRIAGTSFKIAGEIRPLPPRNITQKNAED